MTEEEKREQAIANIEVFRKALDFDINKNDPSTIMHQLEKLHKLLPWAVEIKERIHFFLLREYGSNTSRRATEAMNADERNRLVRADSSVLEFYHGWISGLITEAHNQITILTALLAFLK